MKLPLLLLAMTLTLSGCGFNGSARTERSVNLEDLKNQAHDESLPWSENCVFLHGPDSNTQTWHGLSDEKKESLEELFSKQPYYLEPNADRSYTAYIGPLCDCNKYDTVLGQIETAKLNLPSTLIHSDPELNEAIPKNLKKCVELDFGL